MHSTTMSGMGSGSAYSYYIRCSDAMGNADPSDYLVSFSIASPPAVTFSTVATPNSGSGMSQVFTFKVTDPNGYAKVTEIDTFFATLIGGASTCRIQFDAPNTIYLQNDAATGWSQATLGRNTTLQNSECTVFARSSSVSGSGNVLTLKLAVSFKSSYAGLKSIFAFSADSAGLTSGWLTLGSWMVP
jgi:hypothetical protein